MRKKLALCIPTYNRPECIKELLLELAPLTDSCFSIHVFDSSEDEKTREAAAVWSGRQVFYEYVEGVTHSSQKFFRIYEAMAASEADYVWLMNDHSSFTKEALEAIHGALEEEGDFYLLDVRSSSFFVTDFASLDDFLLDAAWQLTYLGAGIVKRASYLEGADWQQLREKYLTPETREYAQLGVYFEGASRLENPRLKRMGLLRDSMLDKQRYEKPSWQLEKFRICTQCWYETLMRLPEVYRQREKALGTMDCWYLSKFSLMELKEDGGYGLLQYLKYGGYLKRIAPAMTGTALLIALLPLPLSRQLLTGRLLGRIKRAKERGRKVYVYGAGRHGVDCTNYLESCGLRHDGFLVTDMAGNPGFIRDYPVRAAEPELLEGALIILAFLSEGKSQVEIRLEKLSGQGLDIEYMAFNA